MDFYQFRGFVNTVLVDFSAVTESLRLVWFMGHDTVCTSKGFAYTLFVDFPLVTEPLSLVGFMGHIRFLSIKEFC